MKPLKLLTNNGIFFALAFVIWMTIMIIQYANHPYFPEPLPNEVQQMQAAQQAQQAQPAQNPRAQK